MRKTKNIIVGAILFGVVFILIMSIGRRNEKILSEGVTKFDKSTVMRGTGKIRNGTGLRQDITIASAEKRRTVREIKQIQLTLRTAGFNPGAIDGKMGPQTRRALLRFKQSRNLTNIDFIDEKTLAALQPYFKV
jgi:hypothetical protein